MAITKPSKWQTLLDNEDDFRKAGYIGKIPYALVLRWFTLFGILMRFWIHRVEYTGRFGYLMACILAAFLMALFLSLRPLRQDQLRHHIEVFIVILLDIAIISVAYAASQRLQSDTYLFYFLPLILAAEYLPGRWVIGVSILLTLTFGGVLRLLQAEEADSAV